MKPSFTLNKSKAPKETGLRLVYDPILHTCWNIYLNFTIYMPSQLQQKVMQKESSKNSIEKIIPPILIFKTFCVETIAFKPEKKDTSKIFELSKIDNSKT
jgi:hypothetical protein